MPAEAAPISRLARRSLRVHALLIGVVVLATLQAGLLLSAVLQLLSQDRDRIEFHFRRVTGAIEEQEAFMRRWQAQDRRLMPVDVPHPTPAAGLTQGYVPFSLLHSGSPPGAGAWTLGNRLATFFGAFWGDSTFASPRCGLVNGLGTAGLLVPVTAKDVDGPGLPVRRSQWVLAEVHGRAAAAGLKLGEVRWFRQDPRFGERGVLALALSPLDAGAWQDPDHTASPAVGCLLDVDRLDDHRQLLGEPIYDELSILAPHGRLLYGPAVPASVDTGRRFTSNGILYRMESPSGFQAEYRVAWKRVLTQPRGPLIGGVIAALLLTAGGVILLRNYRQSVLLPLRAQHEQLLESEAFSRTILDAAPIGLCLLRKRDGEVILDNAVARAWLGDHHDAGGWNGAWRAEALAEDNPADVVNAPYTTPDDRHLLVSVAAARYRGEDVRLCLFIDFSPQYRAERVLEQARNAAEAANQAKSLFLATMSHEIRTPLYGVLGTLELLGLTKLDGRQQEYVGTIQRSSSTLMTLISDILDVSKAEAGELALEPVVFSPTELTEQALRSYAGSSTRKRLQLYACIDGDVPALVVGDAARIRQVLNNLVSNAIKFTDAGRIVVRLRVDRAAPARLVWQVADSGIGIAEEHQPRLFEPFYQANPGTDAYRGTGLGLAISADLVKLMGGELAVVSELGLGSSFSFQIPLRETQQIHPPVPRFGEPVMLLVRSPSRELTSNLCERLRLRGAVADTFTHNALAPDLQRPLLDVPLDGPVEPWAGPHVVARGDAGDRPEHVDGHWAVSIHSLDAIVEALLLATGRTSQQSMAPALLPPAALGLLVLVAEDNPINQMILREQLESLGCQAIVARDGEEALGYWAARRFDAVLTDINMPHVDGYQLAQELRRLGAQVPIIGATANAAPEERARCLAAGMDGCLVKPITLQALHEALKRGARQIDNRDLDAVASPAGAKVDVLAVPAHLRLLFLSTMREDLRRLAAAQEVGDRNDVAMMVHRIRGGLVMVFAEPLAEQAQKLEDEIAVSALLDSCSSAIQAFYARVERALVYMEHNPPDAPDTY